MNRQTMTRLEKLESKAPQQYKRVLQMIVDDDDPAKEEKIAAFRRENGMTDDETLCVDLIVRSIVKPPFR